MDKKLVQILRQDPTMIRISEFRGEEAKEYLKSIGQGKSNSVVFGSVKSGMTTSLRNTTN
jgi:Flp pilus assembly CpaF family ATPase